MISNDFPLAFANECCYVGKHNRFIFKIKVYNYCVSRYFRLLSSGKPQEVQSKAMSVQYLLASQKYSSDRKRFYRHDRINRGICMDDCKQRMLRFDYDTRMKYYTIHFDNNTGVTLDPNLFRNALVDRAKYHKFASMCVNYDLAHRYGLTAQTDIVYCETSIGDPRTEIGKP